MTPRSSFPAADPRPAVARQTLWPRTHVPVWERLWSRVHAANRVPLAERQREWESGLEEGVGYRKRAERWAGIGNTLVPERLDYRDADGNRTRDTEAVELFGARATPSWVPNLSCCRGLGAFAQDV